MTTSPMMRATRAGPIRNKQMLLEERPDKVVAFHNDLSKSRGTADMLRQAEKRGIAFEVRGSEKADDN